MPFRLRTLTSLPNGAGSVSIFRGVSLFYQGEHSLGVMRSRYAVVKFVPYIILQLTSIFRTLSFCLGGGPLTVLSTRILYSMLSFSLRCEFLSTHFDVVYGELSCWWIF